jgi:hypothetical protein
MTETHTQHKHSKILAIIIVAIFVMQVGFLYLLLNPINTLKQLDSVNNINKISTLVDPNNPLPINELPQIGVVGDGSTLADISKIKETNQIDAQVYANAANGDYVLGYNNAGRLVIFRPSNSEIVYDGESSSKKLASAQQSLVSTVVSKIKAANIVTADNDQIPQIQVVSNPEEVRKGNEFYKDVQKDDLIVTYSTPSLVAIYRPSTGAFINKGQIQVTIK